MSPPSLLKQSPKLRPCSRSPPFPSGSRTPFPSDRHIFRIPREAIHHGASSFIPLQRSMGLQYQPPLPPSGSGGAASSALYWAKAAAEAPGGGRRWREGGQGSGGQHNASATTICISYWTTASRFCGKSLFLLTLILTNPFSTKLDLCCGRFDFSTGRFVVS
jgi:hypothetical protein